MFRRSRRLAEGGRRGGRHHDFGRRRHTCRRGALVAAEREGQVEIQLKDHRFVPAEIHVSAGHDHQLLIKNQDATADEFDSTALKVEKVIGGGRQGVVRLRELPPGRYPFIGEFHAETAQGVIVAE